MKKAVLIVLLGIAILILVVWVINKFFLSILPAGIQSDLLVLISIFLGVLAAVGGVNDVLQFSRILKSEEPGSNLSISQQYMNRNVMLHKVEAFWIKGKLENSLIGGNLCEACLRLTCGTASLTNLLFSSKSSRLLFDTFQEIGQELVILGLPGSGKTTLMLTLARELIAEAKWNPEVGIPVVFNISNWKPTLHKIDEFLINELKIRYNVSPRVGREWIAGNHLTLLFDGLDEIRADLRDECVTAINQFCMAYGPVSIVICARCEAFRSLKIRLNIQNEIEIQPLTEQQIHDYMSTSDDLKIVLDVLLHDTRLRELARTPFFLNLIAQAYQDQALSERILSDSVDVSRRVGRRAGRKRVFDVFLQNRLARAYGPYSFSPEQTFCWLKSLAGTMLAQNQSIITIEAFQASWIPGWRMRLFYVLLSRLFLWLCILIATGLQGTFDHLFFILLVTGGLLLGTMDALRLGVFIKNPSEREQISRWRSLLYMLVMLVIVGIGGGAVASLGRTNIESPLYDIAQEILFPSSSYEILLPDWFEHLSGAFGLEYHLVNYLEGMISLGLVAGSFTALLVGLQTGARSLFDDIHTVENISWSWSKARNLGKRVLRISLLMGGVAGILIGVYVWLEMDLGQPRVLEFVIYLLSMASLYGLGAILVFAPLSMAFGGSNLSIVEAKSTPNQGIWLSFINAVSICVGVGLAICLGQVLFSGLLGELSPSSTFSALVVGLRVGIIPGLWFGGADFLKHFSLRLVFSFQNYLPWRIQSFLDFCVGIQVLQKVGGSYIFTHQLLLEHIARSEYQPAVEEGRE